MDGSIRMGQNHRGWGGTGDIARRCGHVASRMPVDRVLKECGFHNVHMVEEQEFPDGAFPTCPYPNPETREAMELGLEYARKMNADLFLATDPDCDRVGIAVRTPQGDFTLLTGNETGMLLLDYICSRRTAMNTMPKDPVFIKTIVTSDMAERIAKNYGIRTINVLTGFKYIGGTDWLFGGKRTGGIGTTQGSKREGFGKYCS